MWSVACACVCVCGVRLVLSGLVRGLRGAFAPAWPVGPVFAGFLPVAGGHLFRPGCGGPRAGPRGVSCRPASGRESGVRPLFSCVCPPWLVTPRGDGRAVAKHCSLARPCAQWAWAAPFGAAPLFSPSMGPPPKWRQRGWRCFRARLWFIVFVLGGGRSRLWQRRRRRLCAAISANHPPPRNHAGGAAQWAPRPPVVFHLSMFRPLRGARLPAQPHTCVVGPRSSDPYPWRRSAGPPNISVWQAI